MKTVYGSVPQAASAYPMCMGDFWMFYDDVLKSAGVANVPASVGTCPTNKGQTEGQHYAQNNNLSPPHVSWSWHPIPFKALASNTWVEVVHRKDPWGDEHYGAWFFYAKGSGMWFNLGKTISFPDHSYAYSKLHAHGNEDMCKKAAAAGYVSLQFLQHSDGGDYGACRKNAGTHYLNMEIVATNGYGENNCAGITKRSLPIKVGWEGAGGACVCSVGKDLNCHGVPTARTFAALWGWNLSSPVLI